MPVSDWEKPGERWQGFPYELCGRDNRRKGYVCPPLCGTCYNVKNIASVSEGTRCNMMDSPRAKMQRIYQGNLLVVLHPAENKGHGPLMRIHDLPMLLSL